MQHKEQQLIHSLLCSEHVSFIFILAEYLHTKGVKNVSKTNNF